jgi:hypothetical protein
MNRGDYKKAYTNFRPVMAMVNPEWEDEAVYSALLDQCGEETKESQSCLIWYTVHAQKPLEENTTTTEENIATDTTTE